MVFNRGMLLLYAISGRNPRNKMTLHEQVERALEGGITMFQLREKALADDEFIREAAEMRALCHSYGVPIIINDNLNVALKSGADGVHVGFNDEPVAEIRRRTGSGFIIGATAKTPEQARTAESAGADYLGVGAVFPSDTKRNAVRITLEELSRICASAAIPAVAIGGIGPDNVLSLKGSGICGVAAVSSIFSADDIKWAAEELKKRTMECLGIC